MSKKSTSSSLLDVVRKVAPCKPGPKGFLTMLPEDARQEILAVRSEFQAGAYGNASATQVARRVVAYAQEQGWQIVGVKEFSLWLRR